MNTPVYYILLTIFLFVVPAMNNAQPADQPARDMELSIRSQSGNNGVSVSWNEQKRLYYTVYGGSADYPLEVFSEDGESLYSNPVGFDVRGMAYHEEWNCLVGNLYDKGGYFKIFLDQSGLPNGKSEIIVPGRHQPTSQSGGSFNTQKNIMYTIYDRKIYRYNMTNGAEMEEITLNGLSESDLEACVTGTIIYTGKRDYEFLLVDYLTYKLHFFNGKGDYSETLTFDPVESIHGKYNISFSNNRLWCYNKNSRKWYSYLLFDTNRPKTTGF